MNTESIFNFYIKFEPTALRSRIDAVASCGTHPYFEQMRKPKARKQTATSLAIPLGALILYYRPATNIKAHSQRKANFCVEFSSKEHFTSIFPFGENGFAYGDIPHTDDVIIFRDTLQITTDGIVGGSLEIWVARGMLKEESNLLQMVEDGLFDEELESLREQATAEPKANNEPHPYINSVFSY